MRKFIIIALLIVTLIAIIFIGFSILIATKKTTALNAQNNLSDTFNVELRAFSFNQTYKNDMDEGRGDSYYYYLKKNKLTIELWGYGSEDVIEKEINIGDEEFELLRQDILLWIEKYNILGLAKTEFEQNSQQEQYATDVHGSFYIKLYYTNYDDIVVTTFPANYKEMQSDLDEIFSEYK